MIMIKSKSPYKTIDQYIKLFPSAVQKHLLQLKRLVKELAPEAVETISYGIPTFDLHGHLVHFAGYEHHIGFYPTSSGIAAFKDRLSRYKLSKGTVQFPIEKPLPIPLIRAIIKFRIKENLARAKKKS